MTSSRERLKLAVIADRGLHLAAAVSGGSGASAVLLLLLLREVGAELGDPRVLRVELLLLGEGLPGLPLQLLEIVREALDVLLARFEVALLRLERQSELARRERFAAAGEIAVRHFQRHEPAIAAVQAFHPNRKRDALTPILRHHGALVSLFAHLRPGPLDRGAPGGAHLLGLLLDLLGIRVLGRRRQVELLQRAVLLLHGDAADLLEGGDVGLAAPAPLFGALDPLGHVLDIGADAPLSVLVGAVQCREPGDVDLEALVLRDPGIARRDRHHLRCRDGLLADVLHDALGHVACS